MVKNFSNTVDVEKLGIPKIEAEIADLSSKILPDVTSSDNGKVLKVSKGAWGLGNDNSLPDVTSEDNGKVLKVENGAWGVDNVPDGIKTFFGHYHDNTFFRIDLDDNVKQGDIINYVMTNKKPCALVVSDATSPRNKYIFNIPNYDSSSETLVMLNIRRGSNVTTYLYCSLNAPNLNYINNCTRNVIYDNSLPTFTSSDNGKVLQIVNGSLEWVNLDGNND